MHIAIENKTGQVHDTIVYGVDKHGVKRQLTGISEIKMHLTAQELPAATIKCYVKSIRFNWLEALPAQSDRNALYAAHNKAEFKKHNLARIN